MVSKRLRERHQGHLLGFAPRQQTLVTTCQRSIETHGHHGRLVQRRTHHRTTSEDATPAAEATTVAVERCQADQSGELAAGQRPQLGQLGQKHPRQLAARSPAPIARVVLLTPDRTALHRLLEFLVDLAQVTL